MIRITTFLLVSLLSSFATDPIPLGHAGSYSPEPYNEYMSFCPSCHLPLGAWTRSFEEANGRGKEHERTARGHGWDIVIRIHEAHRMVIPRQPDPVLAAGRGKCRSCSWCPRFVDIDRDGRCDQRADRWPYHFCDHTTSNHE